MNSMIAIAALVWPVPACALGSHWDAGRGIAGGADVRFVVKDHAIAERGSHAEPLASRGFYSQLYDIQFQ